MLCDGNKKDFMLKLLFTFVFATNPTAWHETTRDFPIDSTSLLEIFVKDEANQVPNSYHCANCVNHNLKNRPVQVQFQTTSLYLNLLFGSVLALFFQRVLDLGAFHGKPEHAVTRKHGTKVWM